MPAEPYVNGALKITDTALPWTFSLNTKHYQGRTITLMVRGFDSLGNAADASISVTVQ